MWTFLVQARTESGSKLVSTRKVRIAQVNTGRVGVTAERIDGTLHFSLVQEVRTVTEIKTDEGVWDVSSTVSLEPILKRKFQQRDCGALPLPDNLARLLLPLFIELSIMGTVDEGMMAKALITYLATVDEECYRTVQKHAPNIIWMPDVVREKMKLSA